MELRHEDVDEQVNAESAITLANHLQTDTFKKHLEAVLPEHMSSERFVSICLRQLSLIPELQNCTLASVIGGMMTAATLGLEVGTQGECWLIPYRDRKRDVIEAQLQVGVWGHMALAWRSGLLADVQVNVVCHGDIFDFRLGSDPYLHHQPEEGRDLSDQRSIRYAYAVIRTLAGGVIFDAFDAAWIERRRNTSKSPDSPAWKNFYAEQAQAKALKTVLKRCPKSSHMGRAITLDDQADAGATQVFDVDASVMLPPRVSLDPRRQPTPKPNGGDEAAADGLPGRIEDEERGDADAFAPEPPGDSDQPKTAAPADTGGGLGWDD